MQNKQTTKNKKKQLNTPQRQKKTCHKKTCNTKEQKQTANNI